MYKVKILILIILMGMSSCKNNNDGYSDEIETSTTPLDTAVKDTAKIINNGVNSRSSKESTVGTGTGPSASAEDGATYTSESGVQKDSMKLKSDSIKKKKK